MATIHLLRHFGPHSLVEALRLFWTPSSARANAYANGIMN